MEQLGRNSLTVLFFSCFVRIIVDKYGHIKRELFSTEYTVEKWRILGGFWIKKNVYQHIFHVLSTKEKPIFHRSEYACPQLNMSYPQFFTKLSTFC